MKDRSLFDNLFLGVGAMKAGTTWLYMVLARHPDLFFTFEKEIHYFYHRYGLGDMLSVRKRLANAKDRYLRFDPDRAHPGNVRNRLRWTANYLDSPVDDLWYRNLFLFRNGQKYACDFSNLYCHLPEEAWQKVLDITENLRVLYTMRAPVKRLWSHVRFHLQIIGQTDLLKSWGPEDYRTFVNLPHIRENGEYGQAVRRMRAALPPECVQFRFFEDIHADQRGFLRDLEDFLGIAHFDYPQELLERRVNESIDHPMPEFFPGLVAEDCARIGEELRELGLTPPANWLAA